jgi:crotonobetainyl-CoA:carnitine CoA-transferase CaiB-like acyl-CoA transferase
MEDPRFTTHHARSKHSEIVNEAIRKLMANRTMKEAIAHFIQYDVTAAPVHIITQAAQEPHPWERLAMVEILDFLAGTITVSGDFWHCSHTQTIVGSTHKVGEHNEEVWGGLLGYSEAAIAELYAKNVIGNWDRYVTVPS